MVQEWRGKLRSSALDHPVSHIGTSQKDAKEKPAKKT